MVTPTDNAIEVVIWQHPSEAKHPKNSALLLQQSLANCRTLMTETISEQDFIDWCGNSGKINLLLSPLPDQKIASSTFSTDSSRLIVIDGTWRKARKICYLNPWLQQLPTIALPDDYQSHYRIRKAEQPGQYSTLEATCLALSQLEQSSDKYQPLLQAFAQLMDRLEQFSR
ncbi:MAG: DTW domain-containing protein [Candidatus Pelagadaptatus aseana]